MATPNLPVYPAAEAVQARAVLSRPVLVPRITHA